MKSRKIRWMVVSLSAAVLFGVEAIRFYLQGELVKVVFYSLASIIFLLATFGYFKGYLK